MLYYGLITWQNITVVKISSSCKLFVSHRVSTMKKVKMLCRLSKVCVYIRLREIWDFLSETVIFTFLKSKQHHPCLQAHVNSSPEGRFYFKLQVRPVT